jgi:hypothetical protein
MSKRRSNSPRNKKTAQAGRLDNSTSPGTRGQAAAQQAQASPHHANPTKAQKLFLVLAIAGQVIWIVFLAALAVTK